MSMHFNEMLAQQCVKAFAMSTGVGCSLSDKTGKTLFETGFSCEQCRLCALGGLTSHIKVETHLYGMTAAERFGGKYIYHCPMDLACIAAPIVSDQGIEGKLIAGPFLLVEPEDYWEYELLQVRQFPESIWEEAREVLRHIPYVDPDRAAYLTDMLFFSVGFMNDHAAEQRMINLMRENDLQGQITSYINQIKDRDSLPYPFEVEHALMRTLAQRDRAEAQRLLNEFLGNILCFTGRNLDEVKSRAYELLVLLSRTAVDNGADSHRILRKLHMDRLELSSISTADSLCRWLSEAIGFFLDELFQYAQSKHQQVIYQCVQYMEANSSQKITLDELAKRVYLSPSYLSRIFKAETGLSFTEYLTQIRVRKSKALLHRRDIRLIDVALMVGFDDHCYFTRVFKRITGIPPKEYRERCLADLKRSE